MMIDNAAAAASGVKSTVGLVLLGVGFLAVRKLFDLLELSAPSVVVEAVPSARAYVQVSFGAFFQPAPSLPARAARHLFFSFSSKCADFVLEDRETGKIMAIVELDDASHDGKRDKLRDDLTAAAGFLTIRLPADERPTREKVNRRVRAGLGLPVLEHDLPS
jgi:hypothetical protein